MVMRVGFGDCVRCGLYVQLCQMRKRQLYQECRENMSPAALAHTHNRSTKALILATTRCLVSKVSIPATEHRLETCACRTTRTQKRFLANRPLYIYRDQKHKLSHVQSHCTITSDQTSGCKLPGWEAWTREQAQERKRPKPVFCLWQLSAVSWDVLILNIPNTIFLSLIEYFNPSLSASREEAVRAKSVKPRGNSFRSRCRSDLICAACDTDLFIRTRQINYSMLK